jgi:hypothetical protein
MSNETITPVESEEFSRFINAYAVSYGANQFLAVMSPSQRVTFFVTISKTYPDEWKEAVVKLTTGEKLSR